MSKKTIDAATNALRRKFPNKVVVVVVVVAVATLVLKWNAICSIASPYGGEREASSSWCNNENSMQV